MSSANASHVFKTRPHKRVEILLGECSTRGSRFNPAGMTTGYRFIRAGLDRALFALTSGARVTIEECTGVVGRTRVARVLVVPPGEARVPARLVCRDSVIFADLTD